VEKPPPEGVLGWRFAFRVAGNMHETTSCAAVTRSKFYRGKIIRLFRGNQSGVILSETGRELIFQFDFVRMLNPEYRFDMLREGMDVGFDVGRTSSGLRVTVLKLEQEPAELATPVEGANENPAPERPDTDAGA